MRFVCDSCHAQYMINDDKVGPKGVKVRCRKCGHVILVRRTEVSRSMAAPAGDFGEATATQVLATPGASTASDPAATLGDESTSPGAVLGEGFDDRTDMSHPARPSTSRLPFKSSESFLGAGADEIGAVFDQVLSSGPQSMVSGFDSAHKDDDDRASTRVLDGDLVRKLAEESQTSEPSVPEPRPGEVPQTDWFVAIADQQTGPLTLDQLKAHWNAEEVGPDSLCWRVGFDDWIPISDASVLSAALTPKLPKPIIVGAPSNHPATSHPMMNPMASKSAPAAPAKPPSPADYELPPPPGPIPSSSLGEAENSGTWRPSAGSALASLVKAELDVLANPKGLSMPQLATAAPSARSTASLSPARSILDLGPVENLAPASHRSMRLPLGQAVGAAGSGASSVALAPAALEPSPAAPQNPYLTNSGPTYSSPGLTAFRPSSNAKLFLMFGIGAGVLVLLLVGTVIYLAARSSPGPAAVPAPQAAGAAERNAAPPPPGLPGAAPAPAPALAAAQAQATPTSPSVAVPPPAAGTPAEGAAAAPSAPAAGAVAVEAESERKTPTRASSSHGSRGPRSDKREAADKAASKAAEPKAEQKSEAPASDDDFSKAFGSGGAREPKKEAPKGDSKKTAVYIPPAPGAGGEVKESLGQSDIFEVVVANKSSLVKCADEQRKKEPGTSGKLVMRWTIQTNGRATNVSVVTEEYKSTYFAGCVGGLIKTWVFPRHKQQGEPVMFPFKF
jgi:predicted Zn finger-like uncharacterized protein